MTEKRGKGRPSRIDKIDRNAVRILFEHGYTNKQLADFIGVTQQTIDNWQKADKSFFESLKKGKEVADWRVEKSLYERACGWTDPDGKVYPPDPTSMIFWLKNRKAAEWRDKHDHSLQGKVEHEHSVKDSIDFDEICKARKPK